MAKDSECWECVFGWYGCQEHQTGLFGKYRFTINTPVQGNKQVSPDGNVYIISPCGELKGIMLHTPQRFIKNVTHLEKCLSLES